MKQQGIHEILRKQIDQQIQVPQVKKAFANSVSRISRHYKNSAVVELEVEIYNISRSSNIPIHLSTTLSVPVNVFPNAVAITIDQINAEIRQGTLSNPTSISLDSILMQNICKILYPVLSPPGYIQIFVINVRRPKGF